MYDDYDDYELREMERDMWWNGFAWGVVLALLYFAAVWNCGGKS